jgi:DNA-binding XRE family transcriptional regulator
MFYAIINNNLIIKATTARDPFCPKGGILAVFFIKVKKGIVMFTDFNDIKPIDDTERLIILRRRLNLSQFQFAKELGISSSYLGQVERGSCSFSPYLKDRINEYLKREREYELYEQDIFCNR